MTVEFAAASFTALMGPSGSGKSTLLHCAAGLDRPDSGTVRLGDAEFTALSDRALLAVRRARTAVIFQDFNLVPALTALDNVLLPGRLAGRRTDGDRARELLADVGLADRIGHRPGELSGGQQQRVAIARALMHRPDVLFADEPTGALDTRGGGQVLALLRAAVDSRRQTVVMVTHDPRAAAYADRVVFLADGRIAGDERAPDTERVSSWLTRLGT
ncbi:ABC transporter ATP-binding protein [Amycolatopsis samaneae]